MKKGRIGSILCICVIIASTIPVMGQSVITDRSLSLKSDVKKIDIESQMNGKVFFETIGPVSKKYSKVTLIDGSESQMNRIQRHLDRKLFRPLIIFRNVIIPVKNLTFTVEYLRNVENNSRFSYTTLNMTEWEKINDTLENMTIINNIKHNITVENMTGFFIFHRIRLINLRAPLFRKLFHPAKFTFIGTCEKITYT